MSTAFFQTIMGRKFFEADVPSLVRELRDLNQNLARLAALLEAAQATRSTEPPLSSASGPAQ
jgi:hypothetical protein